MRHSAERTTHICSRPARQSGFSLLELVIVVILVALLFLFAFDRLMPLRGQAEGVQVASVVGTLRSALGLEVARRIVDEGPKAIVGLQGANPMDLLQEKPNRYVGEHAGAFSQDIEGGNWYFDPDSGVLRYRVRFPQYLENAPAPPVELSWQVRLQYADAQGNGRYDPAVDRLQGVSLVPLDAHRWPKIPRGLGDQVVDDLQDADRPVEP